MRPLVFVAVLVIAASCREAPKGSIPTRTSDAAAKAPASPTEQTVDSPISRSTADSAASAQARELARLAQNSSLLGLLRSIPELTVEDTILIEEEAAAFKGIPLPRNLELLFANTYPTVLVEPQGILSTRRISFAAGWSGYILRVPAMYGPNKLHLWIQPPGNAAFAVPIEIAETWGDAGDRYELSSWLIAEAEGPISTLIHHECTVVFDIDVDSLPPAVTHDVLLIRRWTESGFSAPDTVTETAARTRLTRGDRGCLARLSL